MIGELISGCHITATQKGWWDRPRCDGEIIALIHSELSEALEALRNGNPPDKHCPDFLGVEVELADVLIRIFDWCGHTGWDLEGALRAKMAYNRMRPHRHGGKEF